MTMKQKSRLRRLLGFKGKDFSDAEISEDVPEVEVSSTFSGETTST